MTAPDFDSRPDDAAIAEVEPVLAEFRRHHPGASDTLIHRAYETARHYHDGQFRKSGHAFITHPLSVAQIVAGYGLEAEAIAAALLHDTVEDTDLTLDGVREAFGSHVASLIDGVTKLDRIKFGNREEQQAATIRKMVIAMARDIRVLLIKLADRLHNVRTLHALAESKQQRIAAETLNVYAPLAHRLGVQRIKHELEDRCFEVLHPRRFGEIQELVRVRAPERDAYVESFINEVERLLDKQGLKAVVSGRPKHAYSIYRKMVDGGRSFEEIHDLIGIRIVTEGETECYAALGAVHTNWVPVMGRFKDYIATPKFNEYQSLHTTVLGPEHKPIEVQIRTHKMHEIAEWGVAAHWGYKEGAPAAEVKGLRSISAETEEDESPTEFLNRLQLDLYDQEVFVLTPNGDVKSLPIGATPVDFAYAVHTEVGHRCTGARVNGRLVSLDTRLESGDRVEVLTTRSADHGPSRDWLSFVRTPRAAAKIRQWFSRERRENAAAEGREQVVKLLRREGLGLSASARDEMLGRVAESVGKKDMDSLYQAVGENAVQASTVVARLVRMVRPEEPEAAAADEDLLFAPPPRPGDRPLSRGIVVEGLADMWVRVARCCAPVPGDDIVGFVTVGRGVSVHRADCTNIASLGDRAERMVEVAWGADQGGSFSVWIQVEALDRSRLLQEISATLSDLGTNILASSSAVGRDRVARFRFEVEFSDTEQLNRAISELRAVEGVFDAFRLIPGAGRD